MDSARKKKGSKFKKYFKREDKKRNTFTGLYCTVQTLAFLLIYFHFFSRKN